MKRAFVAAALLLCATSSALAQVNVNDHVLNVCAEPKEKQVGFIPPFPPIGIPATGEDPTGLLVGATPLNQAGDLFTEVGVDRNIPIAGGGGEPVRNVDLAVSITPPAGPVTDGDTFTLTVTIRNNGPDTAFGTVLTINLPEGLTHVPTGACQGKPIRCNVGVLPPGGGGTLTFTVTANLPAGGTDFIHASITSAGRELDPEDNDRSVTIVINPKVIPPRSDLKVSSGFNPPTVPAGQTALYVAEVGNDGPDGATGVRLEITLPPELTVKSTEPTQGTCTTSGNRVTCNLAALAVAAQARVNLSLGVGSAARGQLSATANVTADQQDPNAANNQASSNLTVEEPPTNADLQVTKSDSADPVRVGQMIRYTVTVMNLGPVEATNIVVTDTLPQGVDFLGCSPTCEPGDVIVRCTIARLAPGTSGSVFIDVGAGQTGTFTNRATVVADQPDPNSSNNSTSETTTVNPP